MKIKKKKFLLGETLSKKKKKLRREAPDWEEMFAKSVSDKGLLSRSYKELPRSTIRNKLT